VRPKFPNAAQLAGQVQVIWANLGGFGAQSVPLVPPDLLPNLGQTQVANNEILN